MGGSPRSTDPRTPLERQLEMAQQLTHVGSWQWDARTNEVVWSDELYRIYGLEPRSIPITFELFLSRVHDDDRARVQRDVTRALEGGGFAYPERIVRPSGEIRMIDTVGEAVCDDDGKVIGLLGTCRDVTEERQRDETVRLQAELVDNVQIGLAVLQVGNTADPDSVLLAAFNPAAEKIAGIDLGKHVGEPVLAFLPFARDGKLVAIVTAAARDAGTHHAVVIGSRDPAHPERAVSLKAFPLPGNRVGLAVEEITEAVMERRLLRAERTILEMIATSAPLPDVLRELVLAIERRAPPMLGSILLLDPDGIHIRHGAAPSLPEAYVRAIDGTRIGPATGSCGAAAYMREPVFVDDIETDPRWADYRDLAAAHGLRACWSTPIVTTHGRVLGTFAMYYRAPRRETAADLELIARVTHLASIAIGSQRAAEQLVGIKAELAQSQKMEAIGKLAGGVAHDFNNLLSVILGVTSLVIDEAPPDSPLRNDLADVVQASEKAADLTRQLLTFSRNQALASRVLDLNASLTRMLPVVRSLAGPAVEVVFALRADRATIVADPMQLEQVVMNLVVNARDAVASAGRITLETSNAIVEEHAEQEGREQLAPGTYVTLTVSDDGEGMDEATRRRIFEPFFTTKPSGRGTGLGLAIVWGVVKQSGGRVDVESSPGVGTTFRLNFPLAMGGEQQPAEPPRPSSNDVRGTETLLLVDMTPVMRATMRRIVSRHGYTVLEADTADAALAIVQTHAGLLHMVLADDALLAAAPDLAPRLAAARANVHLLCIGDAPTTGDLQDMPALAKPFTPADLLRRIRLVLDQPRQR